MDATSPDDSSRRPLRVPRRTPKACKQCRISKIRCSGEHPCTRCSKRGVPCVFPSDEAHVSIPISYFEELKRKAEGLDRSQTPDGQEGGTVLATGSGQRGFGNGKEDERPVKRPRTSSSWPAPSTGSFAASNALPAELDPRLRPQTAGLDALADASAHASHGQGNSAWATPTGPSPHNPLVGQNLSFIYDNVGRIRSLGPTSSWAYCQRALALLQSHSPNPNRPPTATNMDGAAFRLRWNPSATIEPSDVKNLPAADYTQYLYSTVRFHLAELWGIIDDSQFMKRFNQFQTSCLETARNHRLWFVQYLFVLAFGKAFLNHPGQSTSGAPPGSEFASRAMALMPDVADMHEEGILAVEVLSLAALYFQAIDMRISAYQLIGQALRLAYVEGLHLQIPEDIVDPGFAARCHKAWWVVYVLDREMTVTMGCPNHLSENEISAPLPAAQESQLLAHGFGLRVRLAKLMAKTCTTVYSIEQGLGQPFVNSTTDILHELAAVSRDLEAVVSDYKRSPKGDLPNIFRHITLSYHHCIVLTTRPLVMWLFMHCLQSYPSEPQQLAAPIEALLQAGAESANSVLVMLSALAERNLLETFLPFQLEYVFSSSTLLSLLGAMLPTYLPDPAWQKNAFTVLDGMIAARNVVAPLRKSELQDIEELLEPIRHHTFLAAEEPQQSTIPQQQGAHDIATVDTSAMPDGTFAGGLDGADDLLSAWDELYGLAQPMSSGDFMLGLAEQLELGDLEGSFLLQ
ncbi:hypothetical protein PRZ48_008942 [Zasmidium cellare]|uniref:Zn(2)-C6 fungal-type domain-containing protein n=1 Tax=Zasmidium cellare TaxID=395010 RepID=A0ABR0EGW4_ZASCE|nr:hypothetical protein PRZ48_008942 [Zasmidium cellare]